MRGDRAIFESFLTENPRLKDVPVWEAYELLWEAYGAHNKILVCGNGGNAADAEHMVGELMKGFKRKRELVPAEKGAFGAVGQVELADKLQQAIPAISLNSQTALCTAIGNDIGYDMVFAQQVYGYGRAGDVLVAMSTSGNSANVVQAAKTAKVQGLKVIGITGERDSRLEQYCDICLKMPSSETYRIQEYTLPLYHALCAMLEERAFG